MSRMYSSPARSIVTRSIPSAIPPCGGVPYSKASRRWPNSDDCLLVRQSDTAEDLGLLIASVDPDAAAAKLVPVADEVVLLGPDGEWGGVK